jgi:hypothetical protein
MSRRIPLVCRKCGVVGHHDMSPSSESKAPILWVARHTCGALAVAAFDCQPSDETLDQIDAELRAEEARGG